MGLRPTSILDPNLTFNPDLNCHKKGGKLGNWVESTYLLWLLKGPTLPRTTFSVFVHSVLSLNATLSFPFIVKIIKEMCRLMGGFFKGFPF